MALDKAIAYGKEHRKPYRRAKSVDTTCRNHGSCDYCKGNRLHNARKRLTAAEQMMRESREESSFSPLEPPMGKIF